MWHPTHYLISIDIFLRLLGVIYLFVFWPLLFQIKGLLGPRGILPIDNFLKMMKYVYGNKAYQLIPSIFWWNNSDRALLISLWIGLAAASLLILGIWPPIMLLILYVIHLSIVSAGQDFLSFGWEMFLLEITCNAFLLSLTPTPNLFIWISLNLLLFRFHFQGGAVKLQSHDINWKNLTAVAYHYQTQPLPNTIAWYIHKLPLAFQKFSTGAMFFIELVVPFGIFGPDWMRLLTCGLLIGLQIMIWATGNLSYLNHLTIFFSSILLSDYYLGFLFSQVVTPPPTAWLFDIPLSIVGLFLIGMQCYNLWEHFMHKGPKFLRLLSNYLAPYHILNRYGIFAVMTTKRYEIVVEGSRDGSIWQEYLFQYKPSELTRRPRRISPYQPRLDWQMWFLPFREYADENWFKLFLTKLLLGEPEVIKLVRHNPFADKPPKYIRAVIYDYTFSDYATKRATGKWWTRQYIGAYSPILTLRA